MIALIDCDNFYVSCEQLFNPALRGKPVVVLSSNDGCVVSRSPEARALGVKMGEAAFERDDFYKKHNVAVYSSNYALYADISERVTATVARFGFNVDKYSIDECFIELTQISNYEEYASRIRKTILQWTGIPTKIGVARTKTLAKVASEETKKGFGADGVRVLIDEDSVKDALKQTDITDIWGIGWRHGKRLKQHGINTAYELCETSDAWIKKNLSVVGLRTVFELRGTPCLALEIIEQNKKSICMSRSFGKMLTDPNVIREALATHVAQCAEKLRRQNSCANLLSISLRTNPFREDLPQYYASKVIQLPVPTSSTLELVRYAMMGFDMIFKEGYLYKKAGAFVTGIVPSEQVQDNLFDEVDRSVENTLSDTLDRINSRYGRDFIRLGVQGTKKEWRSRQEHLSQRFTTRWDELLTVKI